MRYIPPKKLKVIMIAFFATGAFGTAMGLFQHQFIVTLLGVINICLGGFVGWVFLTQKPKPRDPRKK